MVRSIDIAWFNCKCGHRCTPPEAINSIAYQMELVEEIPPTKRMPNEDGNNVDVNELDEGKKKLDVEKAFKGNEAIIETVANFVKVVKLKRSYAIATHDKTELAESTHIILSCPECNEVLYEAQW